MKHRAKMTEAASRCATILHLVAFPVYVYTIYYTIYRLSMPLPNPEYAFAGKAKYLTQWNLCLCGTYFGLCLLLNVIPLKFLRRLRDYVFCSISLPSSIFVACSFWGLYLYKRELMMPKEIEPFYPKWLNHCSHTLVAITAIFEALLHKHRVPSNSAGLLGMLMWFGSYQAWILYLGNAKDIWVYPVLRMLSAPQLAAYSAFNFFFLFLLHRGCSALLRLKNRKSEEDDMELKKVV